MRKEYGTVLTETGSPIPELPSYELMTSPDLIVTSPKLINVTSDSLKAHTKNLKKIQLLKKNFN